MRLGVHVSIAGGLLEAAARARRLGCTTMQIFSRSPRGGPAPRRSAEELRQFAQARQAADIAPLAIHSPYIINLASPKASVWAFSLRLYQEEYDRAAAWQADYLVTHVGSHTGAGEAAGIARVIEALNRTLQRPSRPTMILLENTAGCGHALGERFEQLAALRAGVEAKAAVGVCLDTAHLFAAGFPIHTAQGLDETLDAFDAAVGLSHLRLLHLNDSKAPLGSKVDRHWHIGQGHIGLEAFRRLVTHPRLRGVPRILETPKKTQQDDRRNLATVRQLEGRRERAAAPGARIP
ncbi:MAG: deoxyribonuclease IV [Candidatus Omnitrophica bacterium]|nr:deoxyribonuclease IV [Candidatus Omnitrophota bacterium]